MTYDFTGKPSITVSTSPVGASQTTQYGQTAAGVVKDSLGALHLDAVRHFDGYITSLMFGVRTSDRTKESGELDNNKVAPIASSVPLTLLQSYSFKNFNVPTILTGDFEALGKALYGTTFNLDTHATPITDRVKEKVNEAYVEATYASDWSGVPVDGNIGLRYLDVKSSSSGTSTVLGPWTETPPGSGNWIQPPIITPVTGGTHYSKILPSVTARFDFGD
eukprot:gene17703-22386_t